MRRPDLLRGTARAAALTVFTAWFAGLLAVRLLAASVRRQASVRRAARSRARARTLGQWARRVARVLGMRVQASGVPPTGPFLLVANHLGYADIVLLASRVDCLFVARGDLAGWPMLGLLARAAGTHFVDRSRPADLPRVLEEMARSLADGVGLVLFPEGTSSRGEHVLPFRSPLLQAAAASGVPVACAAMSYRTGAGDPPASDAVCWWGEARFLPHLKELLALRHIEARIRFGPTPVAGAQRKALARALQASVEGMHAEILREQSAA